MRYPSHHLRSQPLRHVRCLVKRLAFLLFLASPLLAQSRFDGTWEMKMDTLQFSGPPEDYLFADGMYHCKSCIPKVDVKTDGVDYTVTGYAYDTLAVRILNDHAIKFTMKKAGKPFFECIETVSPGGQKMTEDFTNTMEAETVTGKAGFARVGNGPAGSHALSGQWRMDTVKNDTRAGTLTIYQSTPGGMKISDGNVGYELKVDGKDYPVPGNIHSIRSLKLIDEYTLEQTDKTDGKVTSVSRSTLSRDGRSMRVEVSSAKRGQTMTYTAEKRR
jgi:hypothetical protein